MKRLVRILVLVMVFSMTKISVLASEAEISFTVDGRIANENIVTINLIVNDVKDLYAGSFFISFDEKKVQVMEVEAGDLLNDSSIQEVKRMVEIQNNSIDYAFTCLANANGIKGEGTLLKIRLKLKDNELSNKIFSDTLIKLVQQTSEKMDYFNVTINQDLKQSSSCDSSMIKPGQNHSQSNQGNNSTVTAGNNNSSSNSNVTTGNSDLSEENPSKVGSDNNDSDFSLTENTEQVVTSDESTGSDEMTDGSTTVGKDNPMENNKTEGASSEEDETLLQLNLVNVTVTVSVVVFIIILGIYIKKRFL